VVDKIYKIEELAVGEMRIANVARMTNCNGNEQGIIEAHSLSIVFNYYIPS
jgi:hypothetical protein